MSSMIPDSAPFTEEQRAWLNGFFSGLMGIEPNADSGDALAAAGLTTASILSAAPTPADDEEDDFPWHDEDLPIAERMELAEGQPVERKLMAAMAQLDCGSCGYLCKTYSEAIASGEESNLTLCSPGGKETKQMIKQLLKDGGTSAAKSSPGTVSPASTPGSAAAGYSRSNPFPAKLIESRPLNLPGSAKDTRHVSIDLNGSDIEYHVGDALGVYPTNCDHLVKAIIDRVSDTADTVVLTPLGENKALQQALYEDFCLKDPSDELLELVLARVSNPADKKVLQRLIDDGVPEGFDVLDVIGVATGAIITAAELIETLDPLNPRLYSIASSMKSVGNEVHLTVGKVAYEFEGRMRKGVASTMLADRVDAGGSIRVFKQPSHGGFTVPKDPNIPIIMVGPGTGIAPFVAFMQERIATNASGDNWLFFGDQHRAFDFLYQDMLLDWHQSGSLNRLDTAFSRDGDEKVYVQDRMRENGAEVWQWIHSGAHFYVCGDASRMASDVDRMLKSIIAQHGGMTEAEAKAYVEKMSKNQKYVRDVY